MNIDLITFFKYEVHFRVLAFIVVIKEIVSRNNLLYRSLILRANPPVGISWALQSVLAIFPGNNAS